MLLDGASTTTICYSLTWPLLPPHAPLLEVPARGCTEPLFSAFSRLLTPALGAALGYAQSLTHLEKQQIRHVNTSVKPETLCAAYSSSPQKIKKIDLNKKRERSAQVFLAFQVLKYLKRCSTER